MSEQPSLPSFLGDEVVDLDLPSTMDVLLDYFRVYVTTIEQSLEEDRIRITRRYEAEDDPRVRDYLGENLFVQSSIFPQLLRSSFMVSAYSILERGLRNRCQCLQQLRAEPESVDDRGRGIHNYKRYVAALTEADTRVDISSIPGWELLLRYGELRNRLVHHLGTIGARNLELVQWIGDHRYLGIEDGKVTIDNGACQAFIELIKAFFRELDSRLPSGCSHLEPHFGFRP